MVVKLTKTARRHLQKVHGKAFIGNAIADFHVHKKDSHYGKFLKLNDEMSPSVFKTVFDGLISYGRQMFTLSIDVIKQILWSAVASFNVVPAFLVSLKNAALKMLQGGKPMLDAACRFAKSIGKLWTYITTVMDLSQLTMAKKQTAAVETVKHETNACRDIIEKFGDGASQALQFIANGALRIIEALFSIVESAITRVSQLTIETVEGLRRVVSFGNERIHNAKQKGTELLITTYNFAYKIKDVAAAGKAFVGEYLKRFSSLIGKYFAKFANLLLKLPYIESMVSYFRTNPVLLAFQNVLFSSFEQVASVLFSWIGRRVQWLASMVRSLRDMTVYIVDGVMAAGSAIMGNFMADYMALLSVPEMSQPKMKFEEMIDFGKTLGKHTSVNELNRKSINEATNLAETYLSKITARQLEHQRQKFGTGRQLEDTFATSRLSAKLMTQVIYNKQPSLAVGDAICQAEIGMSVEEFLTEVQAVYSLLADEIYLGILSVDSDREEKEAAEFAARYKKMIGAGFFSWLTSSKDDDDDENDNNATDNDNNDDLSSVERERMRRIRAAEQEELLAIETLRRTREFTARNVSQFNVYEVRVFRDERYTQVRERILERIDRVTDEIERERAVLGNAVLALRASNARVYAEKARELVDDYRPGRGKTKLSRQTLDFTQDVNTSVQANVSARLDALIEEREQLIFELNVLEQRKEEAEVRVNRKTFRWTYWVLGFVGIAAVAYGCYSISNYLSAEIGDAFDAFQQAVRPNALPTLNYYTDQWRNTIAQDYIPDIFQVPTLGDIIAEGQRMLNDVSTAIISTSGDAFSNIFMRYQPYLIRLATESPAGSPYIELASEVMNNFRQASTDETRRIAMERLYDLLANQHSEVVQGVPLTTFGQITSTASAVVTGAATALINMYRSRSPALSDLTPVGTMRAVERGASELWFTAARKMLQAAIGTFVGFSGVIFFGTMLTMRAIAYGSEDVDPSILVRAWLAIPATLAPFGDLIFNTAIEAANAVSYSRFAFIGGALTFALMLVPGFGIFAMFRNTLTGALQFVRRRQVRLAPPTAEEAQRVRTARNTALPTERRVDAAMEQTTEAEVPRLEEARTEPSVFEELTRETLQTASVENRVEVRRAIRKKIPPRPALPPSKKTKPRVKKLECEMCANKATIKCTHCDSKVYCGKSCAKLDWVNNEYGIHLI